MYYWLLYEDKIIFTITFFFFLNSGLKLSQNFVSLIPSFILPSLSQHSMKEEMGEKGFSFGFKFSLRKFYLEDSFIHLYKNKALVEFY